jgi:hypothetical protein
MALAFLEVIRTIKRSMSMADAKNISQATVRAHESLVREEDLDDLEALKRDLLARVEKAHDDGRIYLMSQYTRLVALISPEIKRIRDRFDREVLASVRKDEKALRLAARAKSEQADKA